MPNWVYNTLVIHDEPEIIAKIREQLSAPFEFLEYDWQTKENKITTVNEPFSFWNIKKPTNMTEYWDYDGTTQKHDDHWYYWNIRNWGVKWEARDVEDMSEDDSKMFYVSFSTAWGIPDEALLELSRQYPTAKLELEFEEETGWGGENHYVNGEEEEVSTYNYRCNECGLECAGNPDELTFNEEGFHDCEADKEQPAPMCGDCLRPLTECHHKEVANV